MSVQPSPFINLIAKEVADHWIETGQDPDCTPEDIIEMASDYEQLQKWRIGALMAKSPDGVVNVTVLPPNPKEGQVTLVDYDGYTYRYHFKRGHWSCVETRRTGMF